MSDQAITDHYAQPDLLTAIERAVIEAGKSVESVTVEDLAPADEFHIGGRVATEHLLDQLQFSETDHVVDIGCGIGGPSRTASTRVAQVTGVDLTPEYVETGQGINRWLGLVDQIDLRVGSALDLSFDDGTFDGGYLIHVGMNIADKARLLAEVARVLRPGSRFGIYDIMATNGDELVFPLPWATESSTSHVVSAAHYRQAASDAGLLIVAENDRTEQAKEFFARIAASSGPSPLGLHLVMGKTVGQKVKNMVANVQAGRIGPVELILQKPDV